MRKTLPEKNTSNRTKSLALIILICFFTKQLYAQPVITSFTPSSGPIGTTVTINGSNFNLSPANNAVYFGAVKAPVVSVTSTSLTVTVPAGASYQPISVTSGGLTGAATMPFIVTFSNTTNVFASNSFETKKDSTTGASPEGVAIADFDGDGKTDLAVTNAGAGSISIFKNISTVKGAFSFAPKIDFPVGSGPYSITLGDLDGDGKLDMVVANSSSAYNAISILKNMSVNGTISFAAKLDIPTGTSPYTVSIADFDNDGKPDLAVPNLGSNSVSIFKNNSNAGIIAFKKRVDYTTGTAPISTSAGDFDGDGKIDLAVANSRSNTVSIFRNITSIGNDTAIRFSTKTDYATGIFPVSTFITDLNGDGKVDLAVSNNGDQFVSIFQNTSSIGNVVLAPQINFATGSSCRTVLGADLDGDGGVDLAVVNSNNSTISILRNVSTLSAITFSAKVDYTTGSVPWSIAFGDLDGDEKSDMAVTNLSSSTVSLIRNRINEPTISSFTPTAGGKGLSVTITGTVFSGTTNVSFGGVPASSFAVLSDTVIVAKVASGTTGAVAVTTPSGTGVLGGFTYRPVITSFVPASAPVGSTIVLMGSGFSPILPNNIVYFGAVKAIVLGETDTTLTVRVPVGAIFKPISVTTAENKLTGYSLRPFIPTFSGGGTITSNSFVSKTSNSTTGNLPLSSVLGDLDGDGKTDLVVVNFAAGTFSVLRNTSTNGNFSFDPKIDFVTELANAYNPGLNAINVGDVDGDGLLDIVTTNEDVFTTNISVFKNTSTSGHISFAAKIDFPSYYEGGPKQIHIADLNGDGKPEIAVANQGGANITVFKNTTSNGAISFDPFATFYAASGQSILSSLAIVDMDGDGLLDMVIPDGNLNLISILKNTSSNLAISFAKVVNFPAGFGARNVSVADIDGDLKPDVAVINPGNNSFSVFKNTSTKGTISLAIKTDFPVGSSLSSIALDDLDGDGTLDVALTNQTSSVYLFKNSSKIGNISFLAPVQLTTPIGGNAFISVGDLDGNGKPDLVVVSFTNYNHVSILSNQNGDAKPNLGSDTAVTLACQDATVDISTLYNTVTYQTVSYNTPDPTSVAQGKYTLVVSNYLGSDTANIVVNPAVKKDQPSLPGTLSANRECTNASGWTDYYYDNGTQLDFSDDIRLLSLKKNGNDIGTVGDGSFSVLVGASSKAGSGHAALITNPIVTNTSGYYVMNRYWLVTTAHEPATNVGVRFYYNLADITDLNGDYPGGNIDESKLIMYKTIGGNPDPSTNWQGATGVASILNGTVPSASAWVYSDLGICHQAEYEVASFSGGGGGATGNNQALPVVLLNFTAQQMNKAIQLNWMTSKEAGFDHFNVQRCIDAVNFTTIGKIDAKGTGVNYGFIDDLVGIPAGIKVYYRLAEVDKDGTVAYSNILTMTTEQSIILSMLPNPAKNFVNILLSGNSTDVKLLIRDVTGKAVIRQTLSTDKNVINLTSLSSGVYILQLDGPRISTTKKLVID